MEYNFQMRNKKQSNNFTNTADGEDRGGYKRWKQGELEIPFNFNFLTSPYGTSMSRGEYNFLKKKHKQKKKGCIFKNMMNIPYFNCPNVIYTPHAEEAVLQ